MFASIRRGFGFLQQAAEMAGRDRDLLKPSVYALIAGSVTTLLTGVPIVIAAALLRDELAGQILIAVLGAGALFLQYLVTYIFAGMTVRLVYDYLTQGDGRMDQAWATVRRDLFDIMTLAAVSALIRIAENLLGGGNRRGRRNAGGSIVAGILDTVWTVATYFILPAMIIEDLTLGQALKRATYIIKNNLLLVAVTEIGVGTVVGLIGFLLFLVALALGGGLFYAIAALAGWTTTAVILGAAAAVLVAGAILIVTAVLSSYVTTAYNTCLFLWARQVEQARTRGAADATVAAPAPLAAVV
jgi:hypothetical protein